MVGCGVRQENEDGIWEEPHGLGKGSFLESKRVSLAVKGDKRGLHFPGEENTKL